MKVINFRSKNLSILEHSNLVEDKYKHGEKVFLEILNLKIPSFKLGSYFYAPLFEDFIIENMLEINSIFFRDLYKKDIFIYGIPDILKIRVLNGEVFLISELYEIEIVIDSKYILNYGSNNEFMFDTTLIFQNYLNLKTMNHFSKFIFSNEFIAYKLKRKDWKALFFHLLNT